MFTQNDLAKYPFLLYAADYIRQRDLRIDSLESDDYRPIVDRAEERLRNALTGDWSNADGTHFIKEMRIPDIEIPSFPLAVMMAAVSNSDYIKRRYALFEAKRAYEILKIEEKEEKILEIAKIFNWNIKAAEEMIYGRKFDFAISLADFLRNTSQFHEKEWKLVNRTVIKGEVYLSKSEAARLLQEEIRRRIESRVNTDAKPVLPESILARIDNLKRMYSRGAEQPILPKHPVGVVNEAFPPCINQLYQSALSGQHISHVGRFTLTSFLLSVGMSGEDVINLFRSSADFNERLTRYQVEHISGERGSRTKYIPPTCDTLKTHGLCPRAEGSCGRFRHPLSYYRRRIRTLKSGSSVT
ncbi:MAG: DNA primase large subunit PriL [Nitrososphaerota archaeon]|nr:DNA primase large subunit PriL [Candidatus Bathyarchaeota archaeon]MDW8049193.1 DNA primase large subunit PriL [Nitrososphaerota archaeon]